MMTRRRHPTLERIVRWLKPFTESSAAAAAIYGPDLMLQLEIGRRRCGAVPAPPSCQEVHPGDRKAALDRRRPTASDR